ncbi:MAG: App1 family protein [Ginsengibacter sp.]
MTENALHKVKKISFRKKIKHKLFFLFRLNNHPVIKVYNGFGNTEKIMVLGHVLKLSAAPRKTYRQNIFVNLFSMLRLFMVVPFSNAKISIEWEGDIYETNTSKDGFFNFEIPVKRIPKEGWNPVVVRLNEEKYLLENIQQHGSVYIPFASQHAFISDIDDTFLISHSSFLRRRLVALFGKNAHSRKVFEGVVNHYQLLAAGNQKNHNGNPFFYVSGSEWNLYDFIVEFTRIQEMPKGIFLLSRLKTISQFWKSGQTDLMTKFMRIARIIETFPHLHFVLLGDDSQKDPEIYLSVASHFPKKIFGVYIRSLGKSYSEKTQKIITEIEGLGVSCCYFEHSSEAVIHSKMIGLIN